MFPWESWQALEFEKIIEGLRPELAVNTSRTLQEELNPLAITAIIVLAVMIGILVLSGVLSREFSHSLAQLSDDHDDEYQTLDDEVEDGSSNSNAPSGGLVEVVL